ncbi:hypothetical protein THAOC_17628, partial [Thalassiosira oceanica]
MLVVLDRGGRIGVGVGSGPAGCVPATRRRFRVGMAEGRHGGDVRGTTELGVSAVVVLSVRMPSIIMSSIRIPGPARPAPTLLPVDMTWSLVLLALTSAEKISAKKR